MVLGKYVLFSQLPGANRRSRNNAARKQQPPKRAAPKAEWNSYLTEDGRHALSPAEQQRRKELSVSKHHILSQSGLVSAREMRTFRSISINSASSPTSQHEAQDGAAKKAATFSPTSAQNESASGSNDVTALDLLSPPPRHAARRTASTAANTSSNTGTPGTAVLFPPSPGSPFGELETTLDQLQPRARASSFASAAGASSGDNKENVPPYNPSKSFARMQKQLEEDEEDDEDEEEDEDDENGERQGSMSRFSLRSGPSVASLAKQRPAKTQTRRPTRPRPARAPLSTRPPTPSAAHTSVHTSAHAPAHTHAAPSRASLGLAADFDLTLMADQIRTLSGELQFYEEISGKRPILGDADGAAGAGSGGGGGEVEAALGPGATAGGVMRALVQLTCKSMTYLLQAEVESQQNKQDYRKLTAKVDTLTSLLLPHSSDVFGSGCASNTAPSGAAGNAAGRMMGSGYASQGSSALQSSFASHAAHPTYAPQAASAAASASASMLDLSADQWLAPSFPDLSPVRPLRQTQSLGVPADVSAASASAHDAGAARGPSARTVQPTAPVVRVTRNAPSPTASATAAAAAKAAAHTHQGQTQAAASASDFFAHARLTGSSPTDLLFSGRGHSAASPTPTHAQAPAPARGAALSVSASSSNVDVGVGMGMGSPLDRALKAGLSLRLFSESEKFTMPTSAHAHPTDIPVAASSAHKGDVSSSSSTGTGSICRVPSTPSSFQAQAPTRPAGPKRGAWVEGDREELVNSQAAYTVDRLSSFSSYSTPSLDEYETSLMHYSPTPSPTRSAPASAAAAAARTYNNAAPSAYGGAGVYSPTPPSRSPELGSLLSVGSSSVCGALLDEAEGSCVVSGLAPTPMAPPTHPFSK